MLPNYSQAASAYRTQREELTLAFRRGLAPFSTRNWAISKWPLSKARQKAVHPSYPPHKVTPQHEQTLTLSVQLTIDLFPPTSLCTSERLPLFAALYRSCPDIYTHHHHHHHHRHTKLTLTSLLHLHRLLLSTLTKKLRLKLPSLTRPPHTPTLPTYPPHTPPYLPHALRACPVPPHAYSRTKHALRTPSSVKTPPQLPHALSPPPVPPTRLAARAQCAPAITPRLTSPHKQSSITVVVSEEKMSWVWQK